MSSEAHDGKRSLVFLAYAFGMGAKNEIPRFSLIVAAAVAAILLAPRTPAPEAIPAPTMSIAQ